MSMIRLLLPLLLVSAAATPAPTTAQVAAPAPDGFRLARDGTLIHKTSGARFPAHIAGFDRALGRALGGKGRDIVIGYRKLADGHPIVARFALIHMLGITPKDHYTALKGVVGTYFQDLPFTRIAPQGEGPFTPPGMAESSGYQGRFRAVQGRTPYELSLSTVSFGFWDARLTAAYPQAVATQARANIAELVAALNIAGGKQKRGKKLT